MSNLQDLLGDEDNERDNPSTDYPRWLNAEGRSLFDRSIGFRMDCLQYGHDPVWREKLKKEVDRVYN